MLQIRAQLGHLFLISQYIFNSVLQIQIYLLWIQIWAHIFFLKSKTTFKISKQETSLSIPVPVLIYNCELSSTF